MEPEIPAAYHFGEVARVWMDNSQTIANSHSKKMGFKFCEKAPQTWVPHGISNISVDFYSNKNIQEVYIVQKEYRKKAARGKI